MKLTTIYYFLTSSRSFSIHIVFTISAIYYVSVAQLNALELVLIGTILELTVFICEIPTGLFADFFGRKKSFILGTVIIGSAHLLEGSIPEFWAIALASMLWGIGWTFISGSEEAWIADELESQALERVFLKGAQWRSIGSFLGIVMSVVLALFLSVQLAIILAGAFLLLIAIISLCIVPETNYIPVSIKQVSPFSQMKSTLLEGWAQIKQQTTLRSIVWITLFIGLASEGFDRLSGAHFIEGFHLDEEKAIYWFGALFAVAYILNIVLLKWIELYVKKDYARLLGLLNSLLVLCLIGFAYSGNFLLAVLFYWLISALRETNEPLLAVMINTRLPANGRATTLSMFGQVDALGQIAGGPLIGFIALYTSVTHGIAATAIFFLPVVWLSLKMRNKTRHRM